VRTNTVWTRIWWRRALSVPSISLNFKEGSKFCPLMSDILSTPMRMIFNKWRIFIFLYSVSNYCINVLNFVMSFFLWRSHEYCIYLNNRFIIWKFDFPLQKFEKWESCIMRSHVRFLFTFLCHSIEIESNPSKHLSWMKPNWLQERWHWLHMLCAWLFHILFIRMVTYIY